MILYFGNILGKHYVTPTFIEQLAPKISEFETIILASNCNNPIMRMIHMIGLLLLNFRNAKLMLFDTYSHWAFYYALVLAFLSRLFCVPYFPILRGGNLSHRLIKSPFLSRIIFSYSKNNITPSMYLQEQFQKEGYRVIYIPNFIELEKYPFSAREKCSPKLLWVRAFHEIYNPEMAIRVLSDLSNKFPEVELCMVGPEKDGSMKSCRILADELGVLDKVTFTGMLLKKEWIELSQSYDIFINTTNYESFGLSVMEAAACGLVIVTTNSGELKYLYKDRKDAMVVNTGDVDEMVEAISEVIKNIELAKVLSLNSRRKADSFSWDAVEASWKEIISEIKT
ncbi:MAG: glycosyltransferase family 4 protein [Bacteroidetes bacterium]|nr:glycosyltransferase family 4 protein [Bacteroidota bacterium]